MSSKQPPMFRFNYLSHLCVCGFLHEALVDDNTIFPEVIQIIIMQYVNFLLVKIKHEHIDECKNENEEKVEYKIIDETNHNNTFSDIASSIERQYHGDDDNYYFIIFGDILNTASGDSYYLSVDDMTNEQSFDIDDEWSTELACDWMSEPIKYLDDRIKEKNKFIQVVREYKMEKTESSKNLSTDYFFEISSRKTCVVKHVVCETKKKGIHK